MILVLSAYCIAGGVHAKATTGTNIRRAAAGSCSFLTALKILSRIASERSRKQRPKTEYLIRLSTVPKFYVNRPYIAQAGIDERAPFCQSPDTPVSVWLSLRVRTSDYRSDSFL